MFKNRSLAFKQSFYILLCVLLVGGAIFAYAGFYIRDLMLNNMKVSLLYLSESAVNKLDQIFIESMRVARQISIQVENSDLSKEQTEKILRTTIESLVKDRPEIYGISIAFAPYAFADNEKYHMLYASKKELPVKLEYYGGKDYDYFFYDWYTLPKALGHALWTEPYFDDVVMTTYTVPFYKTFNGKKRFMGIIGVDLSLSWLQKSVSSLKLNDGGYAFLISKFGRIITHPDTTRIMNETIFTLAEERDDKSLRDVGRNMIAGKSGFVPYRKHLISQSKAWMYYTPLQSNQWSMAIVFPENVLFATLRDVENQVVILFVAGMLILLLVIVIITLKITLPLRILTRAAKEIGGGNFHATLPEIVSNDEIGKLGLAFSNMQVALVRHIKELQETTAVKEKIESELKIAKDIQLGILPQLLPPFPECKEFSIHAVLNSAKAVGGDLYDFFYLDDEHLCLVIGDVSGKGVPASLFMAVTQTLHRGIALSGMNSSEIVNKVNNSLTHNNDTSMFVTYFLSILNVNTGELQYTNAGHNPPYIIRTSGQLEKIADRHGPPVGVTEIDYGWSVVKLEQGDTLVLYTDGVTEAMSITNEEFGDKRLLEVLELCSTEPEPAIITAAITQSLAKFTVGQEQSDDITVLALCYMYGQIPLP